MGSISEEENIVYSKYPDVDLPSSSITITEMLWRRMENWLDATAFVCGITGKSYTYRKTKELSCNFAASLLRSGVIPGELVGLISSPCPNAVIAVLGIWQAGCVYAPLNPLLTKDELRRDIEILGFKTIVTNVNFYPTLKSVCEISPGLENFILLDSCYIENDTGKNKILFFQNMIAIPSEDLIFINNKKLLDENIAVISSSSGATGLPKSVMLTHHGLCCSTRLYFSPDMSNAKVYNQEEKQQEVTISMYPLNHVSGYVVHLIFPMYQGFKVVLINKFQSTTFEQLLRTYQPTNLILVPPIIKCIVESQLFTPEKLSSIKTVLTGAAPLTKTLIDDFIKKFKKNICFQELYGATECFPVTIFTPSMKTSKLGSCGTLLPNSVAKVVDLETGKTLGPNLYGEIRVISPVIMEGYFNSIKATAEVFDKDGFYCTGDIGYYDEDECWYIVDRKKDVIKVKGFQVLPKEIELVVRTHPKVNDVCVIGVPHARNGEAPRAYIVKNDESLQADEILSLVQEKMAHFKQLEGGIEFIDDIPKVGVGKPLKRKLREQYMNETVFFK